MPSKPFNEMTIEELIYEWHYWDDKIANATSWGASLAAANKFRHNCERALDRKGLVRGIDWR